MNWTQLLLFQTRAGIPQDKRENRVASQDEGLKTHTGVGLVLNNTTKEDG